VREEAIIMVQEVLKEEIYMENSNTKTNGINCTEDILQKCSKLGLFKKKTKPWKMAIMFYNTSPGCVPLLKKPFEAHPKAELVEENLNYLLPNHSNTNFMA